MLNGLIAALTVCYPLLIWLSIDHVQPRFLALGLAAIFLLRLLVTNAKQHRPGIWRLAAPACVVFLLAGALINDSNLLLAYPVFVSLLFFCAFSYSLAFPPTVIERLARLEDPDLPPVGVAYTRKVTWVWSVFFLCNASISLATVWHGDAALWSLYNGVVFYLLMGLLMLAEMLVRRRVKARFRA